MSIASARHTCGQAAQTVTAGTAGRVQSVDGLRQRNAVDAGSRTSMALKTQSTVGKFVKVTRDIRVDRRLQ